LKDLVFITGANGFIGSNFLKNYNKKIIIKKINSKKILKKKNYEDFLEKLFFKHKPQVIIHYANYYTKSNSLKDSRISKKVNYDYGVTLFNLSKKHKLKLFVNVSTALALYKNNFLKKYHYSYFKKKFSTFLIENKKNFKVLQIFLNSTYGDGDTRNKLVSILLKKIKKKKIYLYDTNTPINFISVDDLNKFIYSKIRSSKYKNEKIIIKSKYEYYLKDLIASLKLENKSFFFKKLVAPKYIFDSNLGRINSVILFSNLFNYLIKKIKLKKNIIR
jgi:nucleoside-diphosphate-sugar epimerase